VGVLGTNLLLVWESESLQRSSYLNDEI
jgi:hypothetical protein